MPAFPDIGGTPFGGQLAVYGTTAPMPTGRDFNSGARAATRALSLLLRGEMGSPWRDGMAPTGAGWSASHLQASAAKEHLRFEFDGERRSGEDWWRPATLTTTYADGASRERREYRLEGWQATEVPGVVAARSVELVGPGGRAIERWEWVGVRPLEEGEFARVSAVPAADGEDPIRGESVYTSVFDFRPGARTFTLQTPEGVRSAPIDGAAAAPALAPGWIVAGWIVAGVLVASLIEIRVWRGRRISA